MDEVVAPKNEQKVETPTLLEVDKKTEEKKEEKPSVKINSKDYSWLRKNKYDQVRGNFKTTYILQHKKFPDKIVELKAASPAHACHLIHWKPNQVRLLGTKNDSGDIVDAIQGSLVASVTGTSLI